MTAHMPESPLALLLLYIAGAVAKSTEPVPAGVRCVAGRNLWCAH